MSDIYCPESFPSPVEDAEYTSSPEGIERAMREGASYYLVKSPPKLGQ